MGLAYTLKKAEALAAGLNTAEKRALVSLCEEIHTAETALLQAAKETLAGCLERCEGLCCRNVELEAIIGFADLLYLLVSGGASAATMAGRLRRQPPFFTSNCVFLREGKGPCIFPIDVRPETCITTFCTGEDTIRKEIRDVKRRFLRLNAFIFWHRARGWLRWIRTITGQPRADTTPPEAAHRRALR
jgi:hypothetical protein